MVLSWNEPLETKGGWGEPVPDASSEVAADVIGGTGTATEPSADSVEPEPEPDVGQLWPGTLSFTNDKGIELELLGPLGDPFALDVPDCLFGRTTDGKDWSLLGVTFRSSAGDAEGYATHTLRGELLVRGAHIETVEELPFDRAELRLVGLRELLWHPDGGGAVGMTQTSGDNAELDVQVPGARLTFGLSWEGIEGSLLRHTERTADVLIELDEPLTFDQWFQQWVLPLEDFVAFATREPSKAEAFVALVNRPGERMWWKPNVPVTDEVHRIDFVRQQDMLVGRTRFNYRRVLFYLGELPDPNAVLSRWLELHAQLGPSARFITTALTSRMYIEHKLANLTSAAEGYQRALHDELPIEPGRFDELVESMLTHCETKPERDHFKARLRYANSLSQRQRIRWLYKRAKELVPQLASYIKTDVDGLVDTRNYFTHQDEKLPTVLPTPKLALALRRLEAVVQTNSLLDLGLPGTAVTAAMQRSYDGDPGLS